jgi:hypothetical protein
VPKEKKARIPKEKKPRVKVGKKALVLYKPVEYEIWNRDSMEFGDVKVTVIEFRTNIAGKRKIYKLVVEEDLDQSA